MPIEADAIRNCRTGIWKPLPPLESALPPYPLPFMQQDIQNLALALACDVNPADPLSSTYSNNHVFGIVEWLGVIWFARLCYSYKVGEPGLVDLNPTPHLADSVPPGGPAESHDDAPRQLDILAQHCGLCQ